MENPIYKWMMTGGTPILGNLQMVPMMWKFPMNHGFWRDVIILGGLDH